MSKQSRKFYRDEAFLKQVGERAEYLMKSKSITHEVFNNDTSINPHRLISGQLNLTMSNFKKICDYLEVNPEEFFKS